MESWLKIPASIMAHTELPDWSVEMTPQELAPYIAISKAVGTLSTDLDARTEACARLDDRAGMDAGGRGRVAHAQALASAQTISAQATCSPFTEATPL